MLSRTQIIYAFMSLTRFLSETLKPIVKTEFQLLYVYNLVGPFLQRFQQERTRCMLEVTTSSCPDIIKRKVYLLNFYISVCLRVLDWCGLLRDAPGCGSTLPASQLHGPNLWLPLSHQIHVHWRQCKGAGELVVGNLTVQSTFSQFKLEK